MAHPISISSNVAVKAAEDAGIVSANEEHFVALKIEISVDGINQHLQWGNQNIEGVREQGDCHARCECDAQRRLEVIGLASNRATPPYLPPSRLASNDEKKRLEAQEGGLKRARYPQHD